MSEEQLAAKNRVQEQLVSQVDARLLASPGGLSGREKEEISRKVGELLEAVEGLGPLEKEAVREALLAEILGYGPIQPLLDDPEVTEIMVNGPEQVYVERGGRISATGVRFRDEREILRLIDKIVTPLGRRIDEANPMVDARLPDGSRVNAVIPPVAVKGPVVTIRKFARDLLEVEDLIRLGTLTAHMAQFLEACVRARLNIVVSGGTGSGKTTTLNVLSSFIPPDERIVTIEDAAELQLRQEHVVSLETRPPNIEGRGEIPVRQLVRNALRMRPDRIVVGEVRSGEALDMLQAMNTGHDGSLSTAHANSPRDLLSRLETMVLMAGMELPVKAVREQIASALDLIIHQARLRDGSRRITHITEVAGMEGEVIQLQDIFVLHIDGVGPDNRVLAHFEPTGIPPTFLDRLAARGVQLPMEMFSVDRGERRML
ncbi:MAG: CpaF family protein [Acetobacteraceae bacterium]|nr:CpaF family protein [Acetobacteraceae bacterium]